MFTTLFTRISIICSQVQTLSIVRVSVRNEFERDLRSVEHYLSSSENKA